MSNLTSIIIPCWLLADKDHELTGFTRNCVASIRQHTKRPYRIVIIDNGSEVDTDALRELADVYVRNGRNLGFAPAVNQGLVMSLGVSDWLVVMNNDITVTDGWLATMQDAWADGVGAISSHLEPAPAMDVPEGHMMGALWLTRPSVVSDIGLMDEQFEYGMYEDRDYWRRMAEAGYSFRKAGWCHHIGNATWGKLSNQHDLFFENKKRFENKWSDQ